MKTLEPALGAWFHNSCSCSIFSYFTRTKKINAKNINSILKKSKNSIWPKADLVSLRISCATVMGSITTHSAMCCWMTHPGDKLVQGGLLFIRKLKEWQCNYKCRIKQICLVGSAQNKSKSRQDNREFTKGINLAFEQMGFNTVTWELYTTNSVTSRRDWFEAKDTLKFWTPDFLVKCICQNSNIVFLDSWA